MFLFNTQVVILLRTYCCNTITRRQLSTTNCQLPIANCLLPIDLFQYQCLRFDGLFFAQLYRQRYTITFIR
jgi:hypothetical protein